MASENLDLRNPKNLRGLDKDIRKVVSLADDLEWTGRRAGGGGILLTPPEGTDPAIKPIHVPSGRQDTTLAKRLTRMVMRANPQGVLEMSGRLAGITETGKAEPGELARIMDATDAMLPALTEGAAFGVKPMSQIEDEPAVTVDLGENFRTVTDEKPWLAKKNRSRGNQEMYASDSVIERTWSDGTTDYMCAICREEYTSAKPHAVSAHAGYHTRAKEKPRVDTGKVETAAVVEVEYDPQAERIRRLAREIEAALEEHCSGDRSWTHHDLSLVLAGHVIEHRPARTAEDEDAVPMTDTDVLARIRQMVSGDLLVRQQRLEQDIADLTEKVTAAESARETAVAESTRLRTTLATLSELAREV